MKIRFNRGSTLSGCLLVLTLLTSLLTAGCAAGPAAGQTAATSAQAASESSAEAVPAASADTALQAATAATTAPAAAAAAAAAEISRYYDPAPEDPGMEALARTLEAEIAPYGGDWAVYVRNLNNGTVINLGDQSLPSASVIKIFIAGAYLEAVEEGRLEDTCADSLRYMITESDNSATNRIIDYVGMDNINRFIEKYGFTETKLQRHMLESSSRDNFSSARDAGICLAMIYDGTYVSEEASGTMRNLLLQQERRGKIPAGLPSGTKCGNKTGELNYAENDAAIIWGPSCDYVMVVFAGNISAPGTAQSQIRHLSAMVYEGMNNMGSGLQDSYAADTAATAAEAAADAASTGETASD